MTDKIKQNKQIHQTAGLDEQTADTLSQEANARWGNADIYRQSIERTSKYTRADWDRIKQEGGKITQNIANLMDRGEDDAEVQKYVKEYFAFMRNFYDITPDIFRGLGEMYIADPRFTKVYENIKPGLTEFMKKSMTVFADKYKK